MGKIKKLIIDVRSSLWFIPALLVLGSLAAALGIIELDLRFDPAPKQRKG